MNPDKSEFWVGTFHGRHNGVLAKVTATCNDARPEPYIWTCTCGETQTFLTKDPVFPTAWRHTHPTPVDRLRHWATRLLHTRAAS
ncbi:hypothetical protein ACFV6G_24100 [Streptomyces lavendulae]|uniref:hypothetical protein n=1 Tax=Streptomyces lavendulae TaxID=1914 RepID=UPI0036B14B8D